MYHDKKKSQRAELSQYTDDIDTIQQNTFPAEIGGWKDPASYRQKPVLRTTEQVKAL